MLAGWWKGEWRTCEEGNTCSGSKGTLQANRYSHHGVTRVLAQGKKQIGGEGECGRAVPRRAMKQTNKQKFKVRQPQRAARSKRPNTPSDGSKKK